MGTGFTGTLCCSVCDCEDKLPSESELFFGRSEVVEAERRAAAAEEALLPSI